MLLTIVSLVGKCFENFYTKKGKFNNSCFTQRLNTPVFWWVLNVVILIIKYLEFTKVIKNNQWTIAQMDMYHSLLIAKDRLQNLLVGKYVFLPVLIKTNIWAVVGTYLLGESWDIHTYVPYPFLCKVLINFVYLFSTFKCSS